MSSFREVLDHWLPPVRNKVVNTNDAREWIIYAHERELYKELSLLLDGETETPLPGWEFMVDSQVIRDRMKQLQGVGHGADTPLPDTAPAPKDQGGSR